MSKASKLLALSLAGIVSALFLNTLVKENRTMAADAKAGGKMLAHMVYFTLKESTPANRYLLLAACKKYLADEPGTVLFAVGTVADLKRDVNVRDFDVGLHLVFKDRASLDSYMTAPQHLKFIEENKPTWSKVRVFDCEVTGK